MVNLIKFVVRLNILKRKKVVLQIVLIITLEKSELIHIILYLILFHNVITLIKSVVNEDKNKCYYNMFLEKGWYKNKSDTRYF